MTKMTHVAAAALICALPTLSSAAVVDAGSYSTEATGNSLLSTSFSSVTTHFFDAQVAGTLNSLSIWIFGGSSVFSSGDDINASLLGRTDGGPDFFFGPGFVLENEVFSATAVAAGPQVDASSNPVFSADLTDPTFIEFTWDLSSYNIDAVVGQRFGLRLFPEGDSSISVAGNNCTGITADCPIPPELDLVQFNGSQTSVGFGTSSIVWGYALTVDDGVVVDDPVAPIPLPAGLPLLLAGLGTLTLLRRKH